MRRSGAFDGSERFVVMGHRAPVYLFGVGRGSVAVLTQMLIADSTAETVFAARRVPHSVTSCGEG